MKILFLGDAGVGKTSLIRKILGTNFQPIYIPTQSITREIIYFYGEEHELIDVSGMRKYGVDSTTFTDYDIAVIIYDKKTSCKNMNFWANCINPDKKVKFIGNKNDIYNFNELSAKTHTREQIMNWIMK